MADYKQKGDCCPAPKNQGGRQVVRDPQHSPAHLLTMARPSAFLTSSRSVVMKSREDRRSSPLASCSHQELGVSQHAAQVTVKWGSAWMLLSPP